MNLNMEVPAISTTLLASNTYAGNDWQNPFANNAIFADAGHGIRARFQPNQQLENLIKEKPMPMPSRRLVKVLVIDPDENVPLESALLYRGEEKFTDLTDQELFFELDIQAILKAHNAKRVTIRNKAVKEREELLEPARVRDLRMTVVNVATF